MNSAFRITVIFAAFLVIFSSSGILQAQCAVSNRLYLGACVESTDKASDPNIQLHFDEQSKTKVTSFILVVIVGLYLIYYFTEELNAVNSSSAISSNREFSSTADFGLMSPVIPFNSSGVISGTDHSNSSGFSFEQQIIIGQTRW